MKKINLRKLFAAYQATQGLSKDEKTLLKTSLDGRTLKGTRGYALKAAAKKVKK